MYIVRYTYGKCFKCRVREIFGLKPIRIVQITWNKNPMRPHSMFCTDCGVGISRSYKFWLRKK